MKLIAGLGNPGREYEKTRHNSGFMAVDLVADELGVSINHEQFNALTADVRINGERVLLMKPLTYMNESGSAVIQAVKYYHLEACDVLVLHDDMDLPVGSVRIREKGSSGGQKGMKSIIDAMKTDEITRVRIGVGHSVRGEHDIVPDWVLSAVPKSEQDIYQAALKDAAKAAAAWVSEPISDVMTKYNLKVKKPAEG